MSTTERRVYTLTGDTHRQFVASLVLKLADTWRVIVEPPRRTGGQNDLFHALVAEIAKARPEWNGHRLTAEDWKHLIVCSFGREGSIRLVPDLDGTGLIQLRESTARMSKQRAADLITFTQAWAAQQGIELKEDGR